LTTPANSIVINIGAIYDQPSASWKATLIQAQMPYSIFYRIFSHQSEPNLGAITTRDQACKMRGDLATLGLNPDAAHTTTYMVSAVEAHERVHVATLKRSVDPVFAPLKASVEALSIPFSCSTTAGQAEAQLKALAGYQTAIDTANTNWIT